MAAQPSIPKVFGAAVIASSVLAMPVYAKEGVGAKIAPFGNAEMSSPFAAGENREDPLYSPYSPYGNGEAAVYKRGGDSEIKFYMGKFNEGVKRVEKVPAYASKKTWSEITTELTRFTYSLREAMLRLAEKSADPKAANAAAKTYFADLEDMFVFATKKSGPKVQAAYDKSVTDLATFKTFLK
eukprot:CAMPEP_0174954834 /NCGR_PEP_ID=MMETSP0004_2-20121128/648_1 /TAXON_ID=420556 /ORGANISM="Ochromonas sp., Strain CCMP1393" /LENGTH=182 /DNA_ID=CAMNT_0016202699 /DNA_START=755 /DNA_END=1303 /DNA_ORIENTATION=-